MKGYCMKCKMKKDMKSIVKKTLGKRLQIKGVCTKCGTGMSVFAKK